MAGSVIQTKVSLFYFLFKESNKSFTSAASIRASRTSDINHY